MWRRRLVDRSPLPVREPLCPASRSVELQIKLIDAVAARATGGMLSLPDAPLPGICFAFRRPGVPMVAPAGRLAGPRDGVSREGGEKRSGATRPLAWTRVELPGGDVGSLLAFGDEVSRSPLVEHASWSARASRRRGTSPPPPGLFQSAGLPRTGSGHRRRGGVEPGDRWRPRHAGRCRVRMDHIARGPRGRGHPDGGGAHRPRLGRELWLGPPRHGCSGRRARPTTATASRG